MSQAAEIARAEARAQFKREAVSFLKAVDTRWRSGQTYMLETEECRWTYRLMSDVIDERYGAIGFEVAA